MSSHEARISIVGENGKIQAEIEAALKAEEFEAIALPYMDSIYRSALHMVGNVSDAQDLVQDSYLRAYRFFDKFKRGTNVKAWLLKILRNLWINKYHKQSRAPKIVNIRDIETSEAIKAEETPEDRIFDGLLDDDITFAIDSLPEYFRLVVTLSDLEGLSYREISETMDCPIGTVMSRLYRGRKLLRESLHDYAKTLGYVSINHSKERQMNNADIHAKSSSGKVVAVCLSEERGTVKQNAGTGYLKEGYGLVGDAHAGSGKQVSLLALEDIQRVCAEKRIEASPGDFAENITTSGIDLVSLPVGAGLQIGEAVLKVTRIGKEKHLVHTYKYKGISILPQRGVFASVEKSGHVRSGDKIVAIP